MRNALALTRLYFCPFSPFFPLFPLPCLKLGRIAVWKNSGERTDSPGVMWPIILKWPISPVWPTCSPAHGQLSYVPMVIIRSVRLTCSGRRTVLYIYTYNAAVTTYSRFAFLLM